MRRDACRQDDLDDPVRDWRRLGHLDHGLPRGGIARPDPRPLRPRHQKDCRHGRVSPSFHSCPLLFIRAPFSLSRNLSFENFAFFPFNSTRVDRSALPFSFLRKKAQKATHTLRISKRLNPVMNLPPPAALTTARRTRKATTATLSSSLTVTLAAASCTCPLSPPAKTRDSARIVN